MATDDGPMVSFLGVVVSNMFAQATSMSIYFATKFTWGTKGFLIFGKWKVDFSFTNGLVSRLQGEL